MNDILIVIPIKRHSMGVPEKATRLLAGVAPSDRIYHTARQIVGADVTVTFEEPPDGQDWALDWCVARAVNRAEWPDRQPYQIVVTLQVTSPFTRVETVQRAIQLVRDYQTTVVTVRDDRGLRWHAPANDCVLTTRAPARVVRQQMPPEWRETGAVFATPRAYVTKDWRFAHTTYLLPVTGREALDIDTPEDWALAEWYAGPTLRETLLAKILGTPRKPDDTALAFVLSAWDEAKGEGAHRLAVAKQMGLPWQVLEGPHTRAEAEEAFTVAAARGIHHMVIVTSAYHQPRAFLTFLKVWQERGGDFRLWNVPAPYDMAQWSEEVEKIAHYQTLGHVASYEDGLAYLAQHEVLCVTS